MRNLWNKMIFKPKNLHKNDSSLGWMWRSSIRLMDSLGCAWKAESIFCLVREKICREMKNLMGKEEIGAKLRGKFEKLGFF